MKGTAARTNAIMARSVPLPPPQSPHGNITRRLAAVALPVKAAKVLEVLLEAEGAPVTRDALDPVAPATYAWLAHAAYFRHDFRAAVFYAREALGLAPNRGESRALLGVALARAGDTRDARNVFATLSRFGGDAVQAHLLALALPGARGDPPFVRGLHARDAALVWLARGDHGRALAEMRVAAFADSTERRFFAMDPALDPVRADARFRRWTTGA
jgi:tetratricopeptide (TPR) repeat protein